MSLDLSRSSASTGDMSEAGGDDLQSSWTLYFHDPDDRNWNLESYIRVCTLYRASEFWGLQHRLAENNAIGKGMWFLMREDVFPCWDDNANIDGGCLSFMVAKNDVARVWQEFCEPLMCECMRIDGGDDSDEVNGVSVSPKNDFCIIKIWLRSEAVGASDKLRVGNHSGIFTSNRAKIASDKSIAPQR